MLIKMGVDISRLDRSIRRSLNTINRVYSNKGMEAVITSTYEGTHSPSSLHYANRAVDIRLPTREFEKMAKELQEALGSKFDVVLESTHIHVEYEG